MVTPDLLLNPADYGGIMTTDIVVADKEMSINDAAMFRMGISRCR